MKENHSITGLALGAGGARGLVHIGVLKALEEHGIKIDLISGSSVGSVIGAMYASTLDAGWVETRFRDFINSDLYKSLGLDRLKANNGQEDSFFQSITRPVKEMISFKIVNDRLGLLKTKRLEKVVQFLLPVDDFRDLKIPFKCVAVDLHTGKDVIFSSGSLTHALTASSAIPGYMQPVPQNGKLLVDGGISMPYPISILKEMGAEMTIAVDVNIRKFQYLDSPTLFKIMSRVEQVTSNRINELMKDDADFTIQPRTGDLFWTEFDRIDELVANGYESVCNNLEKIQFKYRKQKRFIKLFKNMMKNK
ncbi:MAG: patatin-like phospholipase family protein [Candidatus Marinimicrobia bacterium]|nr:patatin-like phospholipase family protein [Candidatus Neomarinimicrobiota bacterium]